MIARRTLRRVDWERIERGGFVTPSRRAGEDMSLTQIKEKVARINAYMRHRELPLAIKLQIRSHFSYLWQRTSVWDEDEILLDARRQEGDSTSLQHE